MKGEGERTDGWGFGWSDLMRERGGCSKESRAFPQRYLWLGQS